MLDRLKWSYESFCEFRVFRSLWGSLSRILMFSWLVKFDDVTGGAFFWIHTTKCSVIGRTFLITTPFLQPEQQPPQLTPPQLCNKTRTFPLMMISSVVDFVGCRSDIGNCIHREYRNILLVYQESLFGILISECLGLKKGVCHFWKESVMLKLNTARK